MILDYEFESDVRTFYYTKWNGGDEVDYDVTYDTYEFDVGYSELRRYIDTLSEEDIRYLLSQCDSNKFPEKERGWNPEEAIKEWEDETDVLENALMEFYDVLKFEDGTTVEEDLKDFFESDARAEWDYGR